MKQNELSELKTFIHQITKEQNPTDLLTTSDEECSHFFETIKKDASNNRHFYLALHAPTNTITFQHNLKEFFGQKQDATLDDFVKNIHPNYHTAFFQWAKSVHLLLASYPEFVEKDKNLAYKIMIPLRSKDGAYYWVLQECICIQAMANGQMLTQFNTYTVTYRYDSNHPQEIMGWMSGTLCADYQKDALLKQFYNKISNFTLTSSERKVINLKRLHTDWNYKEIGKAIDSAEETVKKHTKNITAKVKDAFPHHFSKSDKLSFKAVVNYLNRIGYFMDESSDNDSMPGQGA